jgi:ABC-2 type transport system permease protein
MMMPRPSRVAADAAHEWAIVRRERQVIIILFVMPLILASFLAKGLEPLVKQAEPHTAVRGADFAIPGFALLFGFFQIGFIGNAFMFEHGWGTWLRLRISQFRSSEILLGKVAPYAGVSLVQMVVLLAFGKLVFRMQATGSVVGFVLVCVAVVAVVVALALLVAGVSKSGQQVTAFANLGAILLAALGGALLPVQSLPGWAQTIAPVTPDYWAMTAFRGLTTGSASLGDVLPNVGVLFAMAAVLFVGAQWWFKFSDEKISLT